MAKRSWVKVVEFKSENITVRFEPVKDVPGFGYRVRIIRDNTQIVKDWLAEGLAPAIMHDEYYVEKHAAKIG